MRTAGQDTVAEPNHALRPTDPVGVGPVPLLASKITAAGPPAGLIERPRLASRLDTGTHGPLTLLVAPAGWGKTALLAGWFAARQGSGILAWLTVEPADRGTRFWTYLHAALDTALGRRPADRPGLPVPGDDVELFLPRLASALAAQPEPVLVVLDDMHTVSDVGVLRGLEFLLRHCRGRLRLVIAGRSEPPLALHRLRLTGELTEIGTTELALTWDETQRLVAEQGLDRPVEVVRDLHRRAEGWPAGVRLVSLTVGPPDEGAAGQPGGDGGADPVIADYLRAEVLGALDPAARQTLVHTALLDQVCAPLADALTGRADAADRLSAAARVAAGFVSTSGGDPTWYRCHPMLADTLRAELLHHYPDEVPRLHHRAYTWHRDQGRPLAALRHALVVADVVGAAALADAHWPELLLCGHQDATAGPLPTTAADHPALLLAVALDRIETNGTAGTPPVPGTGADCADPTADGGQSGVIAARLAAALVEGRFTPAVRYAEQLLSATTAMPRPVADRARTVASVLLGTARYGSGDLSGAETVLAEVVDAGDGVSPCARRFAAGQLALLSAEGGRLTEAHRHAQTTLTTPACPGRRCAGHAAAAHLALTLIALHRDDLPDAARQLGQVAALAGPGAVATVAGLEPLAQAWLRHAEGDFGAVTELLTPADGAGAGGHHAGLRRLAVAETRMACGDFGGARELLTTLAGAAAGPGPVADPAATGVADPTAYPQLVRTQARIALARLHLLAGEPAAALAALSPDSLAGPDALTRLQRLDSGVIEAVATRALGDQRRARELLERVLDRAVSDGHRRVFTQAGTPVRELLVEHLDSGTRHRGYVNDLVDSAGRRPADRHRPVTTLAEPLTERELTVLRYLQGTLSNGEIAAELFLSVNTVKTHVRNIYQKLGAPRRREAVRRARELRLL
ncbi:LuxR C-terminal-related transcriptional regulator [Solwaraspora sp. WMMD791]|uniref:LuxR C-terminal-related transcriptional regulator n=1 Tax=Solwaraspora sp. WMMD791 TaxID=3016086 RepID=UPI00249AFBD4|nr:LuxR C-terminal-related transcriptional regulator [Solwaraspora sp. WMMD791]WFE28627.1 LuxR C-terminal-related transcriptional regulator [Solwaraspora sp. WMMD791]